MQVKIQRIARGMTSRVRTRLRKERGELPGQPRLKEIAEREEAEESKRRQEHKLAEDEARRR